MTTEKTFKRKRSLFDFGFQTRSERERENVKIRDGDDDDDEDDFDGARCAKKYKKSSETTDVTVTRGIKSVVLAIVGSRNFSDYLLLKEKTKELIDHVQAEGTERVSKIVSGGAKGADALGKRYATSEGLGLDYEELVPDWKTHGRKAGILRNSDIINACDYVIAFWDGKSPGTRDSITKGKKGGKMTVRGRLECDKCCITY